MFHIFLTLIFLLKLSAKPIFSAPKCCIHIKKFKFLIWRNWIKQSFTICIWSFTETSWALLLYCILNNCFQIHFALWWSIIYFYGGYRTLAHTKVPTYIRVRTRLHKCTPYISLTSIILLKMTDSVGIVHTTLAWFVFFYTLLNFISNN